MKDALLTVLLIPVALGAVYFWSTSLDKANKKLVTAIVTYDIVALPLAHFALKAF